MFLLCLAAFIVFFLLIVTFFALVCFSCVLNITGLFRFWPFLCSSISFGVVFVFEGELRFDEVWIEVLDTELKPAD